VTPPATVHFVVPDGVDDPARASGGNTYDRRVRDGLRALGWDVREWQVDLGADGAAGSTLSRVPSGATALIDGLVAASAPAAVEEAADRLRVVLLIHMVAASFPDADPRLVDGERQALRCATRVLATGPWTRDELARRGLIDPARVDVAIPGVDDAPLAIGTRRGRALLCVGAVAPHKGQDVLIDALSTLRGTPGWTCTIAGSLDASPAYAEEVAEQAAAAGIDDRIRLTGVLDGSALDRVHREADLVVAPSRAESYGMAIADALGRGIPVLAGEVGGIPHTVAGRAAILVPPDEPRALADALERWMAQRGRRRALKRQAVHARRTLPRWTDTVERVAATLAGAS
jgi:glycosyltransferase involved in cell wall biosynthesis